MDTGRKIRELRKKQGWSQEELGAKLGVQKNAVSKWECGTVKNIPADTIKTLAELFEVSVSYLVDEQVNFTERFPDNIIPLPDMGKIPLLGPIACGTPILADNNVEEYIDFPRHIRATFALTCKGDSMINARIYDGDIVYILKQDIVENGEIAAVLIENEATLKRFYRYPDHIVLEPENPMHRPLKFWDEEMNQVHVLGKAVAFSSVIR